MPKYQIITHHDAAQCIQALDDMLAHDPRLLEQVWFGCHHGDHTGYGIVDEESEEVARNRLPSTFSRYARVTEVEQFTPDDIREGHEQAA